jgi:hypothetical protein
VVSAAAGQLFTDREELRDDDNADDDCQPKAGAADDDQRSNK